MANTKEYLAKLEGGESDPIESSIWDLLASTAAEHAKEPAVISRGQPKDLLATLVGKEANDSTSGLTWTYSQLVHGALNVATIFQRNGVKPHSILLVFVPPVCAEWSLLWWAANYLKLTLVTVDVRALEPARIDELRFYLRSLRPETVVVYDSHSTGPVDAICGELHHSITSRLTLDAGDNASGWTGLAASNVSADVETQHSRANSSHNTSADLDRTTAILFTSGTSTGQPKGCPLTERNFASGSNAWNMFHNKDGTIPRAVMMFANSRGINLFVGTQCWLAGGTLVYLNTGFTPEGLLDCIEQNQITEGIFIPPQLRTLIGHPSFSRERVRSIRKAYLGGDVVNAVLQDLVTENFPNATTLAVYAMTEALGFVGWPTEKKLPAPLPAFKNMMACGTALKGSTIKIVEEGHVLQRKQIGEIHIKGPVIISSYRDGLSPDSFYEDDEGKWFITGDTGTIDENDYVYIFGRKKDIMKRIGIPVPPVLLENVLATFANIKASVFGLPNPKLGEEPVAVVASLPDHITKEELQKLVVEHLGPDYALGKVFTLEELGLNDFPVNVTGKIMKIELREAVKGYLVSQNGE